MQVKQIDSSDERTVLIGMIVNRAVLARIAVKWKHGLFRNKWSNLIGSWCVKHYERYEKAPGPKIEDAFRHWAEKTPDESTVELVERFLAGLNDDWIGLKRESNTDYVLDLAQKHFALVQVQKLKDDLDETIEEKDPDKAFATISQLNRIDVGSCEWIDPLADKQVIRQAFESNTEPLIVYPGDLGRFFSDRLERDGFIAFEGPEKRGKTFWLMDTVFRGVEQRRRVAYYQVGDMSRNQIMRRMMIRVASVPRKPGKIKLPLKIAFTEGENSEGQKTRRAHVVCKEKHFEDGLDWRESWKACDEYRAKVIKSHENYLRLVVVPNNTLSVPMIHGQIREWTREDWVPDVIVIDYADILRMDYPGMEKRDQINQAWMEMRQLSQVFHCLVVTATQTNAASYKAGIVGKQHFSEDKRKRAHTTGNVGLNQTEDEKAQGLMRLNWIQLREAEYLESRCIYVAGCPDIGNLALRSSF